MTLLRSHANLLTGRYVDRLAHWRKDEAQLQAALEDPNTLYVPVWRNQCLVRTGGAGMTALLVSDVRRWAQFDAEDFVLLGEFQRHACFAVSLTTAELPPFGELVEPHDLRTIAGELPASEAGLLAYARAMIHWRDRHRFCSRCGSVTQGKEGGHVRQCSNPECAVQDFPRIDPAIIVLITDGPRALLGRQASWPAGRYSTIAGFVEPGESLEDAVIREVFEETGVHVDTVDYHSSQPWPFPSSLMLGFTARASSTEIRLTDAELEDARWLSREQIAAGEVALPLTHSISFRLIEDWYNAGATRPLREEAGVRMWRLPRG
jgi:NAD+ diphosphatase